MTTKKPGLLAIAASLLATVALAASTSAASGALSINSVGSQQVKNGKVKDSLSGTVPVQGTAAVDGASGAAAQAPLVADAGDSPFVTAGQQATLVGTGYGGTEPYTFAWTTTAGTVADGANSATAMIDT